MRRLLFTLLCFISLQLTAQKTLVKPAAFDAKARPKDLSDSALLDLVQKQTFKYFWDFAHPVSGMARERSNESFGYGNETITTGGDRKSVV